MQQFANGNNTYRDIYIKISNDEIRFYFVKDYNRHQQWVYEMEQLCEDVHDEDKEPTAFYYMSKSNWCNNINNNSSFDFKKHMAGKNWFTKEMHKYIDSHINTNTLFN